MKATVMLVAACESDAFTWPEAVGLVGGLFAMAAVVWGFMWGIRAVLG